jgi:hypothetical protein
MDIASYGLAETSNVEPRVPRLKTFVFLLSSPKKLNKFGLEAIFRIEFENFL